MKKVLAGILAAAMIASLAACGSKDGGNETAAAGGGIQSVEDLAGKQVGVQEGTTGDQYATGDDLIGEDHVIRYKTAFEAVQALLTGKIDAIIIDDQVAQNFVHANEGLQILETPYAEEDYALYLNKDETELLENVNAAIAEIQSNGVIEDIVSYYIDKKEDAKGYHEQTINEFPNGTLTIAVNANFPPYEYLEGEEVWGFDADMCRALGDILGMEVKFQDMEFAASLAAVQTGKCEMAMGAITVTEDRAATGNFTDSYYTGKQVIIVAK
jgi:ABC-type amino acid transport substrate-binding protein